MQICHCKDNESVNEIQDGPVILWGVSMHNP